jgi:cholest-4-en-3-one 26-monooxygenase|tara:strand:- start:18463 stop:19761 length:1299 start_codon:yes stop_codon:yes gene_type:complete
MRVDEAIIHDLERYRTEGYPWAEWDLFRKEAPVYWYERDGITPFWSITRYEDVRRVSGDNAVFANGEGRLRLDLEERDQRFWEGYRERMTARGWDPEEPPDFIYTDRPVHWDMRRLVAPEFTPKAMRSREESLILHAQLYAEQFAKIIEENGTADLVEDLAVKLPLATICEMMGASPEDWEKVHAWTAVLFDDPALMRFAKEGESKKEMRRRMFVEFEEWIFKQIADRRSSDCSGPDLISILLRSEIDSQPLTPQQLLGYIKVLILAGNETTRNAATGGMIALIEHPTSLRFLADRIDESDVVDTAVEEILRWTSPVIQFARVCTRDTEVNGQIIRAGDHVGIWHASANRDERQFPEPYLFDVQRTPNEHLAFGHGAHFCLGTHLARWELRSFFRAVIPTLCNLKLDGAIERVGHLHVGPIQRQMVVSNTST